jgi:hypothetical protein
MLCTNSSGYTGSPNHQALAGQDLLTDPYFLFRRSTFGVERWALSLSYYCSLFLTSFLINK